ncbi:GIY-YIG nuclease family protein [Metabacillus malikii]|uniref:LuxR family transcriptional regulator n=1 Tax=Metabacillus malikii TaxID=1504265 RepID=A0ABT9ZCR3_9BACI|nr:GIY-YIG nuclease family protein [Metabacillus malikii]MDQ0229368.1 hypothetical protein [Metabacillus malikii]
MEQRKEIKRLYKETPVVAGVYQIHNKINGKRFIASTRNIKTLNGVKFSLETGVYVVKELQNDWKTYGSDSFEITVLEKLKKKEDSLYDEKKELEKLETKWLEHFQPYDLKGYNKRKMK